MTKFRFGDRREIGSIKKDQIPKEGVTRIRDGKKVAWI